MSTRHIIPFTGGFDSMCVLASLVEKLKHEKKDEYIVCTYVKSVNVQAYVREIEVIDKTINYVRWSYDYENIVLTTSDINMNIKFKGTDKQKKEIYFGRDGYQMIPIYVSSVIFALGIGKNFIYLPFNKQDYSDASYIGTDSHGIINRMKKIILDLCYFTKQESVEIFLPLIDLEKSEVIEKLTNIDKRLAKNNLGYFEVITPSSCQNKTECITLLEILTNITEGKDKPKNLCTKCNEIYDAFVSIHERSD